MRASEQTRSRCGLSGLTTLAVVAASAGLSMGCRALAAPFLLWGEKPTKTVVAEYTGLRDRKVCLAVWAEMETLFEYPNVQFELSEHLRVALQDKIKGVAFIPNRQVVDQQRRDPEWDRTDPAVLGARFGAERALMVELSQYTTREPDSPHLYRGRISAAVKVFEAGQAGATAAYKTTVETVFPPDSVGQWGSDDNTIRLLTMEAFAAEVATRFYDRKVEVRK